MSDHYYSENPESARDTRLHEVSALGLSMQFYTDAGVFSKTGLDEGSALLLESLPALSGRVLDLGCGWGALGVTLAVKYQNAQFLLSDVNARAVELSAQNILKNRAENARAICSDGFEHIEGAFDFIVTNPPIRAGKKVIYAMFETSYQRLNRGGALFLVIRKQQGAESAQNYLRSLGFFVERVARDKGFWILKCTKEENLDAEN